ncbi:hypothetical protein L5515_003403 [Caenorhabditis briggsae]|uniref:Uncharacterized protein n=1 Tax=Caenorhabditis briggsae TaxID=6238 RepID=A0AAE9JAD1_CAEBR|nr:hypothetical protein L5515_003403 [Caenorhabditis briggsae]
MIPPPAPLPDNIQLSNAEFCADYNEQWIIGSEVDEIELDSDYVMNPDSFTTDDDDDDSKKIQKSKKDGPPAPGTTTSPSRPVPPSAAPPSAAPHPAAPSNPFPSTVAAKQGK